MRKSKRSSASRGTPRVERTDRCTDERPHSTTGLLPTARWRRRSRRASVDGVLETPDLRAAGGSGELRQPRDRVRDPVGELDPEAPILGVHTEPLLVAEEEGQDQKEHIDVCGRGDRPSGSTAAPIARNSRSGLVSSRSVCARDIGARWTRRQPAAGSAAPSPSARIGVISSSRSSTRRLGRSSSAVRSSSSHMRGAKTSPPTTSRDGPVAPARGCPSVRAPQRRVKTPSSAHASRALRVPSARELGERQQDHLESRSSASAYRGSSRSRTPSTKSARLWRSMYSRSAACTTACIDTPS